MKKTKNFLSILLAMLIMLSSTNNIMAEPSSSVIYIDTVEDLITFSEKCSLDIYSENKIFELTNDIDLTNNTNFKTIPSFSGIFYGNNHTIKGFNNTRSGSDQGFFRYLQEGGLIKNLNIKGHVEPSGTKKQIGGIVGTNRGQIANCSFNGEIKGKTSIGGIAGYNDKTGKIINCEFFGIVIGKHYTGGIVGQNLGYVGQCINHSEINTTADAIPNTGMVSYDLKNIDVQHINSTENIDALTDTGGIVGYNQGVIETCKNYGLVGYNHVGYNNGGIVGRQSGYMSDCINYGTVNGRKDVGGIVGQAEPFINLLFSEDTLEQINDKFNKLNQLTDNLINNNEHSSNTILDRLENLNSLTNSASDKMEELLNGTTNYVDETTSTIDTEIERVRHSMRQLEPVIDNFVNASDELTNGFEEIERGFDQLTLSSVDINNSIADLNNSFDHVIRALKDVARSSENLCEAIEHIDNINDSRNLINGMMKLEDALKELKLAIDTGSEIINIIKGESETHTNWTELIDEIKTKLGTMSTHLKNVMPKLIDSIDSFNAEYFFVEEELSETLSCIDTATKKIDNFSTSMTRACEDIQAALSDLSSATTNITISTENFSKGIDYFSNASDECTTGIDSIKAILKEFNEYEDLQLPKLNDYVTENSDALFDEIDNISSELNLLNQEAKNASNTFNYDLKEINQEFKAIIDIIKEGLDALSFDNEDLFEDISDQNLQDDLSMEKGIIKSCTNNGGINGDVNVGGITGSMAIEYDFDPEDDIINKGNKTFNFKYQTKALIFSSINNGNIQAKKDYAGGIIGRMDLGLITQSTNYGFIENIDGDYTGGIAGSSNSVIRNCYSLSELSGKDYVGGIAGYGCDIYNCLALIDIDESNEFTGAIAGDIDGKFENNYFVSNTIDGIDGISYNNKAMPQSYEDFILHEDLPETFKSFQLTFVSDGHILKIIPFNYGDSLDIDKIPSIPKKDGYYSEWPEYDYDHLVFSKTLEAIYTPNIPVLSSEPGQSQPQLLVEGAFKPEDTLIMNEVTSSDKVIGNNNKMHELSIKLNTVVDKPLTYRLLKPDSNKEIILYQKKDNKWKQIKTTTDGSYLCFSSDLQEFKIAIVEKSNLITNCIVLGSLALIIMFFFIVKIKKKHKHSNMIEHNRKL